MAIHQEDLPGEILIFLTGQQECEAAVSMLEEEGRRLRRQGGSQRLRLMPVPLYAGMPAAHQLGVFDPAPRGYRKVGWGWAGWGVSASSTRFVARCAGAWLRQERGVGCTLLPAHIPILPYPWHPPTLCTGPNIMRGFPCPPPCPAHPVHVASQLGLEVFQLTLGLLISFLLPIPSSLQVVVATNIAETSVTIEGVVYVIDSCFSKQRSFNPLTGLESLLVAPISKASAAQRAGRAGRMRPGHAFRLCTEADFEAQPEATVPEMQRSDLSGTVLQLKSLGVDNLMRFDWLAPPPAEAMVRALESLHALGALEGDARLSRPLGVRMAELPLEPVLARVLLAGAAMKCAHEVATVVAMLSVQSVWAPGERRALDEARARWVKAWEGDLGYGSVWRGAQWRVGCLIGACLFLSWGWWP